MNKVEKALRKLSADERTAVEFLLSRVEMGDLAGLDIKRLKGLRDTLRIRKGSLRLVYKLRDGEWILVAISHRSEKTCRQP